MRRGNPAILRVKFQGDLEFCKVLGPHFALTKAMTRSRALFPLLTFALLNLGTASVQALTGVRPPMSAQPMNLQGQASLAALAKEAPQTQIPTIHAKREAQILEQVHAVFHESWRLLIGSSEGSGLSIFKSMANSLKQPTNFRDPRALSCRSPRAASQRLSWLEIDKSNLKQKSAFCGRNFNSIKVSAELKWIKPDQLQIIAYPQEFAQVVGDSVSLLNPVLNCRMLISHVSSEAGAHLEALNCSGFAASIGRSQHVAYREFKYSASGPVTLSVKADRYENLVQRKLCDGTEPCLVLYVPRSGNIKISEDHRTKEAPQAPIVQSTMPAWLSPPMASNASAQPPGNLAQVQGQQRATPAQPADGAIPLATAGLVSGPIPLDSEVQANAETQRTGVTIGAPPVENPQTNQELTENAESKDDKVNAAVPVLNPSHPPAEGNNENQQISAQENVASDVQPANFSGPSIR